MTHGLHAICLAFGSVVPFLLTRKGGWLPISREGNRIISTAATTGVLHCLCLFTADTDSHPDAKVTDLNSHI